MFPQNSKYEQAEEEKWHIVDCRLGGQKSHTAPPPGVQVSMLHTYMCYVYINSDRSRSVYNCKLQELVRQAYSIHPNKN